MRIFTLAVAAALLGLPTLVACQVAPAGDPDKQPLPPTPLAVQRILVAQPFTLQTPYTDDWNEQRPQVYSGTLVVLAVNGAYLVPRNATVGPVLYAGDTPVKRLNHGHQSGRVIALLPNTVNLATAPLWFATPNQTNTPDAMRAERLKAEQAAMVPLPAAQLRAAQRPAATARDLATLLRTVGADLVLEYSPQEKDLAEIWRLPTAKPPPPRR